MNKHLAAVPLLALVAACTPGQLTEPRDDYWERAKPAPTADANADSVGRVQVAPHHERIEPVSHLEPKFGFAHGSAALTYEQKRRLDDWADALRENPKLIVRVTGHTALPGDEQDNRLLASQRARAVAGALLGSGAEKYQVMTRAAGEYEPEDELQDRLAAIRNDRVTITVAEHPLD